MSRFYYEAVDAAGRKLPGILDVESQERLLQILEEKGQILVRASLRPLSDAKGKTRKLKGGRVTAAERSSFAEQMARLLESGCPMDRALEMASGNARSQAMAAALDAIRLDVQQGIPTHEAASRHPNVFGGLFLSAVAAGEAGGFLAKAFLRLATYEKNQDRLRRKVIHSLTYPAFMIATLVLSLGVIFTFVVPSLVSFFEKSNMDLPAPTVLLIAASNNAPQIFAAILGAAVLIGFLRRQFGTTPAALMREDRVKLALPVLGDLIAKLNLGQFCRTLGLLLDGGVPIDKALIIARQALSNRVFQREIDLVAEQVTGGESLSRCLEVSPVFPDQVAGQVRFGEETGRLDKVLESLAEDYENQAEGALETMVGLVEPMMIVVMGVVMGFIVISLFMPMVQMVNTK